MKIGLDLDGDLCAVSRGEAVAIYTGGVYSWGDIRGSNLNTLDEETSALVLEATKELVKSLLDKQKKV